MSRDKRLLVYCLGLEMIYEKKYEHEAICMSFSRHRNILCVGLDSGEIDILDLDTRLCKRITVHGKAVATAEFGENGLLATGGADGVLRTFSV